MARTVVILGAGWAGLPLAHKLLKYTAPKLPDLKVILVSPSSHFFWNVAATRGIIPGEIPDSDMFIPIEPAFKDYRPGAFQFILGAAEKIDSSESTVTIRLHDKSESLVHFDQLVIATGSRVTSNLPLKLLGSYEETLSSWHSLQGKVNDAKSFIIAGGGPTGVEVAGELAAKYGRSKKVTLVMSGDEPVPAASGSVRGTVSKDLHKLGVEVVKKTRVTSAKVDDASGQTEVTLSNGETIKADLYLPLSGVTVNSSFLPADMLDAEGSLVLQPDMRVQGMRNIWGIGDAGNLEPKQLTVTDNQIIHLATELDGVLTSDRPAKRYSPESKTMIFLSLGRKHSTGQIGNWRLPGFTVNYVKGRRLFTDTAKGYVGGQHLRHAKM